MPGTSVTELMAELAELENPKVRAVNEKHGDDHGVNLSKLRVSRAPKVQDWLVNYVVKKNAHVEGLRVAWMDDADPMVASAGWALTSDRVAKKPAGLNLPGLLDTVEEQMKDAPDRPQWAMNQTLATIGIEHEEHRARAVATALLKTSLRRWIRSRVCPSFASGPCSV